MTHLNAYLGKIAWFLFIILVSIVYGFLIQINPIPPLNILLWGSFCYLIYTVFLVNFTNEKRSRKIFNYIAITVCIYLIYIVKSVYFVSYFNGIYLTGSNDLIPLEFEESIFRTIVNPSIFLQKLEFLLAWDTLSISFGGNNTIAFGSVLTNIFRMIEILGILFTSLIFNGLFNIRNGNSQ